VDDVARAALRDQIMLQGPAKTRHAKDGSLVKTGAADSAHLRAFCAEGDDDSGLYVVVSQDNDATRAFKSWDIAAPAFSPAFTTPSEPCSRWCPLTTLYRPSVWHS
jgi:hypothetical protein